MLFVFDQLKYILSSFPRKDWFQHCQSVLLVLVEHGYNTALNSTGLAALNLFLSLSFDFFYKYHQINWIKTLIKYQAPNVFDLLYNWAIWSSYLMSSCCSKFWTELVCAWNLSIVALCLVFWSFENMAWHNTYIMWRHLVKSALQWILVEWLKKKSS